MKSMSIFAIAVFLLICSIPAAAKDVSLNDNRYAGLRIHIGHQPDVELKRKDLGGSRIKKFSVNLTVDKSGRVTDIAYPSDSVPDLKCFKKAYEKIEFTMLEGAVTVAAPAVVPVKARLVWQDKDNGRLMFDFPVRQDSAGQLFSDTLLLTEYCRLNGIERPGLKSAPPISYLLPAKPKDGRYLIVTALVSINETGAVRNIIFPFESMREGQHQVFATLLHSEFEPLRVGGVAYNSEFYVTFRLFDNIKYPFKPIISGQFDSTATHAQKYFVTEYLNPNDMSLCPLPREFPHMSMPMSGLSTRARPGFGWVEVNIDTTGQVVSARKLNASEVIGNHIQGIAGRLTFYPAVDVTGKPIPFTGKMRIEIDKEKNVVYFPEWLR
ncbi:MAG: hypothetical protein R3F48_06980 [Candidatus Zixiibacteriota bacterium]